MTKAFICILLDEGRDVHSAIIDCNNLPPGANSNVVAPFDKDGLAMASWLQSDLLRAAEMVDKIQQGNFDEPTLKFITQFASFVENAPPATEEKAFFIGASRVKCDILRTDLKTAEALWRKITTFGK